MSIFGRRKKNDTKISSTNYLSVRQLPLQDSGLMIWELTIIIVLFYIGSIILEKVVNKEEEE